MEKTLDTRINKGREGQNLFLHLVAKGATSSNMKPKSGASKVNVSMPKDLFDYLKRRVEEHNAKPENIYRPTDFSKMVQKAVHEMMEHDRSRLQDSSKTNPLPDTDVSTNANTKMVKPYKRSAGGSSTATNKRSRKIG